MIDMFLHACLYNYICMQGVFLHLYNINNDLFGTRVIYLCYFVRSLKALSVKMHVA